jgi:hypothetical protein
MMTSKNIGTSTHGRLRLLLVAFVALAVFTGTANIAKAAGLPGGYHAITVVFDQRPLHCLLADGSGFGESSGLACDWVRYHATSGNHSHGSLPDGYHSISVSYDGRPLHCLLADGSGYGEGSGLSCDWVAYHKSR